jgi:ribosome-associated protein
VTSDGGIDVGEWSIPQSELEERFDTPGGPGGQHANRTETAVTIRFDVGASSLPEETKERLIRRLGPLVEATAADTRSQWRNRELARERLAQRLREALVERKPRRRTKPPKAATERRLAEKKALAEKKRGRQRPDQD